ncbi:MAG: hypothetical protein GY697_14550, partial [Desulfobacterales bacterium]|nr:hypothetical protein [Desulfobacterales bacterium]
MFPSLSNKNRIEKNSRLSRRFMFIMVLLSIFICAGAQPGYTTDWEMDWTTDGNGTFSGPAHEEDVNGQPFTTHAATPSAGYGWNQWEYTCTGHVSCPGGGALQTSNINPWVGGAVLDNSTWNINATFTKIVYNLDTSQAGSGTVTADTTYVFDDNLAVVATPAAGWRFKEWTGDIGNLESAALASTKVVNPVYSDTSVSATFIEQWNLTVQNTEGAGSGTVDIGAGVPSGQGGSGGAVTLPKTYAYDENDTVQLTAAANFGSVFLGWKVDGASAGTTATISVAMNTGNHRIVEAIFSKQYTLAVASNVTEDEGPAPKVLTFTVTATPEVTAPDTVNFDIETWPTSTATPGVDFVAIAKHTETMTSLDSKDGSKSWKTFDVTIIDDDIIETLEYLYLVGSDAGPNALPAPTALFWKQGFIANDDQFGVTVSTPPATTEGSPSAFTVGVTLPAGGTVTDLSVRLNTADGSATTGDADYTDVDDTLLNFPAADTSDQTFNVVTAADTQVEYDETFTLTADSTHAAWNTTPDSGTGTITNDDAATLSISDVNLAEGDGGPTAFDFTVTLSAAVGSAVTVVANTADGSATAGSDFGAVSNQTVTFTPGGALTQTVTVNVTGETLVEYDETFTVNLTDARFGGSVDVTRVTIADAQGLGTIPNDDTATLSINDVSLAEGDAGTTAFDFTVTLSDSVVSDVTVVADTSPANATGGGTDYNDVISQTVTFTAGGALTQTVTVTAIGDSFIEADETFQVNLTDALFGGIVDATRTTITAPQGLGTIVNDDQATLAINDVSHSEGANGDSTIYTFTVTLSGDGDVDQAITVDYTTTGGSATSGSGDFLASAGMLNFAGTNNEFHTIDVTVNGDDWVEYDETFSVTLSNIAAGGKAVTFGNNPGTGTITNDDKYRISVDDVTTDEP